MKLREFLLGREVRLCPPGTFRVGDLLPTPGDTIQFTNASGIKGTFRASDVGTTYELLADGTFRKITPLRKIQKEIRDRVFAKAYGVWKVTTVDATQILFTAT